MFSGLRKKIASFFVKPTFNRSEYISPTLTDTLLAIHELNAFVQNDTDAIEIYLALASLYRVQGDIERSLQIHARLLVRPELPLELKARIYAELGKDYKRAGLVDRALSAFLQAKNLGYTDEPFLYELLDLYDMMSDFHNASLIAQKLDDTLAESYYIAKQVDTTQSNSSVNKKLLSKAISISPELVLAWKYILLIHIQQEKLTSFHTSFTEALNSTPKAFLLLEGILTSKEFLDSDIAIQKSIVDTMEHVLSEQPQDFLLSYYLGMFFLLVEEKGKAKEAFLSSLSLKEDFWAVHYELFSLTLPISSIEESSRTHIAFFIDTGQKIKRFSCGICALSLNSSFHICPRCKHIQSIRFRTLLQE